MKVLQINSVLSSGSTGRIMDEIGNKLLDEGHESYVAFKKKGPNGSQSNKIRVGNPLDRYLHGLKTRFFDMHGFGSTRVTKKLVKKIDEIKPDLIGLHNLHGYYLNIEVLFTYLKSIQKPVVWTFHDCWPFTGHCSFFDFVSCERWKTGCYDCPLSDKYPTSWLIDNSKSNYRRKKELFSGLDNLQIVTPSKWLAGVVQKSFMSQYSQVVINNGIDLGVFFPNKTCSVRTKYDLKEKVVLLGVASTWDRRKGLNYFIELSKRLDDQFKIVLIGLSDDKIRELPPKIIGIKRTENIKELTALYSTADIFLNPTLVDNFPTTNLEALACGTPVITFDTGGSSESIDEKTGIVVEKGNLDQLYTAILRIVEARTHFKSEYCRERALNLFNKEDRYNDYLKLYTDMVRTS